MEKLLVVFRKLKLSRVMSTSSQLQELHVAGVGRLTESDLMAHSILSAPFHPFQYPSLLWSVSKLGSRCGKKDRKKVSMEKKANRCCLNVSRAWRTGPIYFNC